MGNRKGDICGGVPVDLGNIIGGEARYQRGLEIYQHGRGLRGLIGHSNVVIRSWCRHAAAYPSCCPLIPAQRSLRGRINTSRTSKRAQRAFGVPESVSLCDSAGRTARAITRWRLLLVTQQRAWPEKGLLRVPKSRPNPDFQINNANNIH